jgi:MFS family permease
VLPALCVTVTVSYGVLYYAFTVLAPSISADTGWSAPAVTAAFSAGNLVGALVGIAVGRLIQRRGPRVPMTAGSVVGAVALALVAVAPTYPVFLGAWLLAGVAGAGTFYPPAFAALTHWIRAGRVRALTTLTLVAGFASTVFAPLTAALEQELGWRGTYLAFAALLLVGTVPTHARALAHPWRPVEEPGGGRADHEILTSRAFVMLAASGTLAELAMYASLVNLVPLLLDHGLSMQLAAWVLGLSGAGQVAGRLLYPALARRSSPHIRATTVIAVMTATLAALALVSGPLLLLVAIAVAGGAARGLFTLVAATAVTDRWGPERYAALNGVYQAPLGVAAALAPALGAALAAYTGSYAALFTVLAAIGVAAAALAAFPTRPTTPRSPAPASPTADARSGT